MATAAPIPLSPAQRAQIRRLSQPAPSAAGEEAGELNVVPYLDIITNIMMFVLASVAVSFASTIDTHAAAIGPRSHDDGHLALHLTALIARDGIALTSARGAIAHGCADLGAGITVPKKDGAHDLAAVSACARRLKEQSPDFAGEEQVTVSADPDVPYDTLIAVMDALRSDDRGPLFPKANLGVAR